MQLNNFERFACSCYSLARYGVTANEINFICQTDKIGASCLG